MAKRARHLRHRAAHHDDENTGAPVEANEKVPQAPFDERPHMDVEEGIIRDPVMYNGEPVSYVKDIGVNDVEYDPNVRQVLLQPLTGKRVVVPAKEINKDNNVRTENERTPDRRPELTFPTGHPDALPGQGR